MYVEPIAPAKVGHHRSLVQITNAIGLIPIIDLGDSHQGWAKHRETFVEG